MAFHATRAAGLWRVKMVRGGIVDIRLMTLQTNTISGSSQFKAVWFVAITTGHPGGIHLALHKRSINVDFVIDLTIGVI